MFPDDGMAFQSRRTDFFLCSGMPMKNHGRNDDRCVRRYRTEERTEKRDPYILDALSASKRSDGSTSR